MIRNFTFEIKYDGSGLKVFRTVTSKHLHGAVRKLYQQEERKFEIKRIVED